MNPRLISLFCDTAAYRSERATRRETLAYLYARAHPTGEFEFRGRDLAQDWGWHLTQVERWLKHLQAEGLISVIVYKNVYRKIQVDIGEKQQRVYKNVYKKPKQTDPRIREVFEYWSERRHATLGLNGRGVPMKLTKKRSSKVSARLGEGYGVAQLKAAVDGCMASEYHVEGGYLDLELICRDQSHVERFLRNQPREDTWRPPTE